MSIERLIAGSSLAGQVMVSVDGGPAPFQHARLADMLARRHPALAGLFATPEITDGAGAPPQITSWRARTAVEPVPIGQLDGAARAHATGELRSRLEALAPRLADPATAPLVGAALMVPSSSDLLWGGDGPVIVNWGFVPAGQPLDPAGLRSHFHRTVGALLPDFDPWAAVAPQAPVPLPPAVAAAAPVPGQASAQQAAGAVLGALAIVVLLALGALGAGYYLGWLNLVERLHAAAPARPDTALQEDLRRIQDGVNQGLRDRINRLETTLQGNVCLATPGPLPAGPNAPGQMPGTQATPVPPPPAQQPVERPPAAPGQPAQRTNLADLIDESVVLILGMGRQGAQPGTMSSGTGFAISPDTVVTNRHVVEGTTRIIVVSRKLGRAVPARIVAQTPNHEFGQPDFALLKIEEGGLTPLVLSPTAERLIPVVAAGFPGFVTGESDEFRQFLQGNTTAAPSAHVTSGEIGAVQQFRGSPVVIHTAAINRGNSGGPLLDRCGRVLGVNTFIRTDRETAYRADYALPTATLQRFLGEHGITARTDADACNPQAPTPPQALPQAAPQFPAQPAAPAAQPSGGPPQPPAPSPAAPR